MRWLERAGAVASGIAYVLAVLGLSLHLLLLPAYTRVLVGALDVPAFSGLPPAEALSLAEQVRAYVAWPSDTALPERLDDGRAAFDAAAVSHLDDVRDVITGARLALLVALVTAGVFSLWAWRGGGHRRRLLARSLRAAAWVLAAGVTLVLIGVLVAFDSLFVGFHALFFEGDTWLFPFDALLIRLFPVPFWVTSGIAWGMLALLGAAALGVAARGVKNAAVAEGE